MRKGINLWCFPSEWSLKRKLIVARDAGFQGVELNVGDTGYLTYQSSNEQLRSIKSLVEQHDLEITSISSSLFWEYPLTSNDTLIREKASDILKKMIEIASFLSVSTILVVPGLVTEEVAYDVAYERSKYALLELADYAKENKVVIAIENVWNKFLMSPLEMKRFIEEINHSHVGVYFDVGNIMNFGFPDQWIRILGDTIKKIHVKDFRTELGNFHGFTTLLQGDVNWESVMIALQESGYNDYITAEIMPPKFYPEPFIHEISSKMDVIIKGGQQ